MVSFHVLLLDRAGNNLVNADFSPYSRMFFAVKHIYLTLYIAHMCRIAPIYSAPLYLLALLAVRAARSAVHVLRPDRFQPLAVRAARSARCPCGRVAVLAAPVLAPVRSRARVGVWACARVCVGAVRLPSSRLPCISFAYNGSFHSPIL